MQAHQPPGRPRTGRSKKRCPARDRLPPPYRLARGYASMTRMTLALLISLLGFYTREARAMDTADQVATLVKGNSEFALDLYARISQGDGNRFISPFSISTALAMTYAGAQEETAVQIAKALRFTLPPGQLHPAFHRLIAELHGRTSTQAAPDHPPDVQLFTANALWTQTGERILPDFQKRIEVNYQGGLYPVDFRHAPDQARRTVNAWVEEQTKGKIRDLLKSTHIDPTTILVLTNAIYFNALWASPFSKEKTAQEDLPRVGHGCRSRRDDEAVGPVSVFRRRERFRPLSCPTRATRCRW